MAYDERFWDKHLKRLLPIGGYTGRRLHDDPAS